MRKALFKRFLSLASMAIGHPIHAYWYDPTKPPGNVSPNGLSILGLPNQCPLCNSHQQTA